MKISKEQIINNAKKILPLIIEIRRHIHMYPELSFVEEKTSIYIQQILSSHGIEYSTSWVKTGIVAKISGKKPGKVRAFRSELDALPIQELTGHAYSSKTDGIMHACGHDLHTACLIGAAIVLETMKEDLEGTILFVFQPGEEKLPGGAKLMLEEGVFAKEQPEYIIAQHVYPQLPAGKVGLCSGLYMASADEIYISIKGKGGHGALPHQCVDPIVISSEIVLALQKLVSRYSNPIIPSVLTIGKINSVGGATNIIPEEVTMEGTFRTMDESWRHKAHLLIKKIITEMATAHGATAEVRIEVGYPCLANDESLTREVRQKMISYLGEENVVDIPKRMTSEDFAFFANVMPACFYRLGVGNESKGIVHGVHNPMFDVDEAAMETGIGLIAWLAL